MATSLLIDAVDRNAQHPDTFEIPPHHERSALKVGQCAKIGVEFPGNEGRIAGERFWVEVVEFSPPVFVGRVVNDLVHTREHGFTRSDRVEFAEFNVLALE